MNLRHDKKDIILILEEISFNFGNDKRDYNTNNNFHDVALVGVDNYLSDKDISVSDALGSSNILEDISVYIDNFIDNS